MSAESETPTPLPEVPVSKMATRAAIELRSIALFPAIAAIESTTKVNSAVLSSLGTGLAPGINYVDATTGQLLSALRGPAPMLPASRAPTQVFGAPSLSLRP